MTTLTAPIAAHQFDSLTEQLSLEAYNIEHFRTIHLLRDARRTLISHGLQPGVVAPDFALTRVGGGTLRLSDLRGRPTLLHFGSYT